ncbi:MAG: phosphoribosylformylglycinamidine synthase [Bacteroidetes bacterium]|nr:phosphoribosylformylglycinamidine synthase [Bacteroidota bacterium]
MLTFFRNIDKYYAVEHQNPPVPTDIEKLTWLFSDAECIAEPALQGTFVGPRKEMITPWSTNAVEITQNMGVTGITRIEEFSAINHEQESVTREPDHESRITSSISRLTSHESQVPDYDPMLQHLYQGLGQESFLILHDPEPVIYIEDLASYNMAQGLALSGEEIDYLVGLSKKIGRKLTDSEVFGFSQVNSEHCRHKIFNGTFIIDGKELTESLFDLIKKTSKENPNFLVSAYKDNVAFITGPEIEQFAPGNPQKADFFVIRDIDSVISLKAETHNFPTTVEPFNGAATGSGGEIRDRMAGGKGSIPMAGTAVYMTSYPRLEGGREWEKEFPSRKWLYKTPEELLIKASNGASDFGNKFGQPLICGSVLTFEHTENNKVFGYDKVIMLAGGIGFGKKEDSLKDEPEGGEDIIILGGDNYRIGMGGGAVSSVATGEYGNAIELNAVQRSNPEMQKRVFNTIRAMVEMEQNPIISIHDHGAGGHLNSISELVEATGGTIRIDALPIGDPTLSDREIISNESQERMGLLMKDKDISLLKEVASRERAPLYITGKATGDHQLVFEDCRNGSRPIDLNVADFFGKPPKTIMRDSTETNSKYAKVFTLDPGSRIQDQELQNLLQKVLQLEAVACKDWLTNKVDRAISGKIAMQQTCGPVQLPLNNLGVVALDYQGEKGIATSLGHAPAAGLIDPAAGSRLSIAEALTNLIWAPLTHGLKGVSLSANWMWPCKNPGEDARLYKAVQAVSEFAISLGINIPTGKDSLSMTQKYPDGDVVYSPGTVIISAVGEVSEVSKTVSPLLSDQKGTVLVYINLSADEYSLGGSSFAQVVNKLGNSSPDIKNPTAFAAAFAVIQEWIKSGRILAGHDISAGGLITSLLEMTFPHTIVGLEIDLDGIGEVDLVKLLFSENPGLVLQVKENEASGLQSELETSSGLKSHIIGHLSDERRLVIRHHEQSWSFDIDHYRDIWFKTSYLLDRKQCGEKLALERYTNYKNQPLKFRLPEHFTGKASQYGIDLKRRKPTGVKAAIIREQGVNRDRDMAWAMYMAGMDVKDIHMTDLISGRETLEDVNMIAFVGGFSNSDVLGSAKGWAGSFLYNEKARKALNNFFARKDTLSLGVCNGCQLLVELGLIYPEHELHPKMSWNDSHKYECAFINLSVQENHSVMLHSLAGSRLGVWTANGEGKFNFPLAEENYHIPAKFSYHGYPANPNGSQYDAACISSIDGRHLAIMPHIEDSVLPWQWAYYPEDRKADEVTPWIEAFVNARKWIEKKVTKSDIITNRQT